MPYGLPNWYMQTFLWISLSCFFFEELLNDRWKLSLGNICDIYVYIILYFSTSHNVFSKMAALGMHLFVVRSKLNRFSWELQCNIWVLRTGAFSCMHNCSVPSCYVTLCMSSPFWFFFNFAVWSFCEFRACCLYKLHRTKSNHGSGDNCCTFSMLNLMIRAF
jgi:hypothetical protein